LTDVDLVARLGGEEFAVVLPSSDASTAFQIAERLRGAIEANNWPFRPVTASFGVATQPTGRLQFAALIDRADKALRHSKRRGCNRVSHADPAIDVAS
jgi:diguanylate cyclase (GGDEF)-like protein